MLKIVFTGQFKKDYKLAMKRGCDPHKLEAVIRMISSKQKLPDSYRDHALVNSKNYKGVRECHIDSDWLSFPNTCQICKTKILMAYWDCK